jgi:hypothetical protein
MFDFGASAFNIMFFIVFAIIVTGFIVIAVHGLGQWKRNNNSPRLTVDASVVSRRISVAHHENAGSNMAMSSSTSYYATFQVESGDRMELRLSGPEYGMLVEGDRGKLTFQGTRYLGFVRS